MSHLYDISGDPITLSRGIVLSMTCGQVFALDILRYYIAEKLVN